MGQRKKWIETFPLHKKKKFSIKDFFSKCDQFVTFTEETLNGKLYFFVQHLRNDSKDK